MADTSCSTGLLPESQDLTQVWYSVKPPLTLALTALHWLPDTFTKSMPVVAGDHFAITTGSFTQVTTCHNYVWRACRTNMAVATGHIAASFNAAARHVRMSVCLPCLLSGCCVFSTTSLPACLSLCLFCRSDCLPLNVHCCC